MTFIPVKTNFEDASGKTANTHGLPTKYEIKQTDNYTKRLSSS